MLTNAWAELDKSLTTDIIRLQLSCCTQITCRVSSMDNFQTSTGGQNQPEHSCGGTQGILSYPQCGEQPWHLAGPAVPLTNSECSWCCLKARHELFPGMLVMGLLHTLWSQADPSDFTAPVPVGTTWGCLWLPQLPQVLCFVLCPPWALPQLLLNTRALQQPLLTALTDLRGWDAQDSNIVLMTGNHQDSSLSEKSTTNSWKGLKPVWNNTIKGGRI